MVPDRAESSQALLNVESGVTAESWVVQSPVRATEWSYMESSTVQALLNVESGVTAESWVVQSPVRYPLNGARQSQVQSSTVESL